MTDLEFLEGERERLRAEYRRVVTPLTEQLAEVNTQITNLKREAGQLFYVEYMRHYSAYTEECETLEQAKAFARALIENGSGSPTEIHGPGTHLYEGEWD